MQCNISIPGYCKALQTGYEMVLEGLCTEGVSLWLRMESPGEADPRPINCEHHGIALFGYGVGAELIKTHVTAPARRHSRLHSLYWLGF